MMSVKVAKSRFITSSFAGFYQQTLSNFATIQELGSWLIRQAEIAQAFREREKLEEISTILCNFPNKEVQTIGQYYKGLCVHHRGEDAQSIFEQVVENSKTYKAKALMSLAAVEARKREHEREHSYFLQSVKYANNISLIVEASRCIAVVKAKEGFRREALKDIESLFPLVKYAAPSIYYQYLNSFAVELIETGRIEEASNISRIVLASPFAFAYPEWRENGQELALRGYKSRSSVPVIQSFVEPEKSQNVLRLPERERSESTRRNPFFQPSDVTSLEAWKKKMVKEPNGDDKKLDEMNDKDLFMELMRVASDEALTSKQLRKMVDAVKKIASQSKD